MRVGGVHLVHDVIYDDKIIRCYHRLASLKPADHDKADAHCAGVFFVYNSRLNDCEHCTEVGLILKQQGLIFKKHGADLEKSGADLPQRVVSMTKLVSSNKI